MNQFGDWVFFLFSQYFVKYIYVYCYVLSFCFLYFHFLSLSCVITLHRGKRACPLIKAKLSLFFFSCVGLVSILNVSSLVITSFNIYCVCGFFFFASCVLPIAVLELLLSVVFISRIISAFTCLVLLETSV